MNNIKITKERCLQLAAMEGDQTVGAGAPEPLMSGSERRPCSPSSETPETNDATAKLERERDAARRSAEHMRDSFLNLAAGHPDCIQFDWENDADQATASGGR